MVVSKITTSSSPCTPAWLVARSGQAAALPEPQPACPGCAAQMPSGAQLHSEASGVLACTRAFAIAWAWTWPKATCSTQNRMAPGSVLHLGQRPLIQGLRKAAAPVMAGAVPQGQQQLALER